MWLSQSQGDYHSGQRAVIPKANFKYPHQVSVLATIFGDVTAFLLAVLFKGENEPRITNEFLSKRLMEVVYDPWVPFWQKDVASVDTNFFKRWVDGFIPVTRGRVCEDKWIVLFYDGLRAHMSSHVIDKLADNKIAVMALPSHTSDCLHPLYVSVFGPYKRFSNLCLEKTLERFIDLPGGAIRLGSRDVWD